MKRVFASVLVLLTLLVITTGTVFAGSALELVDVRNDDGGPTFIFRVTGEFSEGELNGGFVSVEGGGDFPLYCEQIDADTVVCHTSKKVGAHDVVVGFGGARFWVYMPDKAATEYCEPIYDLEQGVPGWGQFGLVCMDRPAVLGDTYITYNPFVMAPDWTYFFLLIAPGGYGNDPGQGYYPITDGGN